jgi:hypothetical protein
MTNQAQVDKNGRTGSGKSSKDDEIYLQDWTLAQKA